MSDDANGLEPTCPSCGSAAAAGASFCKSCGSQLHGSAAGGSASGTPPPLTPTPMPSAPGQPTAWGIVGPDGQVMAPQNGFAIAALVLGLIGLSSLLCGPGIISSILAIIFGVLGRKKAEQGLSTNGGMANAGLILGIIGVVGLALLFLLAQLVPSSD